MNVLCKLLAYFYGFPTDLYVFRHGESKRNVGLRKTETKLFFDTPEQLSEWGMEPDYLVPLTPTGIEQAREAGKKFTKYLKDQSKPLPDVFIHSGYTRAHHTTKEIMNQVVADTYQGIPIIENFSLREREAGITHVLTASEVEKFFEWNSRYHEVCGPIISRPVGGESVLELREGRTRAVLRDCSKQFRGKSIVFVCHGRVMQAIHMEIMNMNLQKMHQYINGPNPKNCEMHHYKFDFRIRRLRPVFI